ncbi:PAS domain S-box protein [Rufibacter sp. LB8]|uniref:PAS domain S-box protein n=1 Tax=Rufibacter sp. LB8 TaxID=2777781 RepID=UPI00178C5BA2
MRDQDPPAKHNKASTIKWEKFGEVCPDLICTFDGDGYYTFASQASLMVLGYTSAEMIGKHFSDFLHPDDVNLTHDIVKVIKQGAHLRNFENRLIHKDGRVIPLLWSASWAEEDSLIYSVARDISELVTTRQQLSEREQRYKALFQNNPDIVFLEDRNGLITEVNQGFCQAWNVTPEEAIHQPASAFFPPDLRPRVEHIIKEVLQGKAFRKDLKIEVQGEQRIFDTLKFPIVVNGEVMGAQTISKDITQVVESYQTIEQQAQKLNTIFESMTDAFMTLDRNWLITYVNSEAERMVGLDKATHLGKSIWEIFPEEKSGEFFQHYTQAITTGAPVHFTPFFKEMGMWLSVKAYPSADGLSVYFEDITEQVTSRQELEKLSLVASRTNNSVVLADKNWHIEWVNEGFERLYGYTLEEARGQRPSEFLHSAKTDKSAYEKVWPKLLGGELITFEILNVKKNGEEVWLSVDITPILNDEGEITQFIAVQTDVTNLKNSELELSQLAKDLYRQKRDLQEFTYIISHNLRGPVANLLGLTNLLKSTNRNSDAFAKGMDYLSQSVSKLDEVLLDLNTLLGIRDSDGYLELEPVCIEEALERVLPTFQGPLAQIGGLVQQEIPEGLLVKANKAYLHSIFYNLLSNAIKYKAEERPLHISISCSLNLLKNEIELTFTDNGSGFDVERARGNLFKLYKRFHVGLEGRGIGLFLVKSHLDAMGGHVHVTSQVGQGTTFMLTLPTWP